MWSYLQKSVYPKSNFLMSNQMKESCSAGFEKGVLKMSLVVASVKSLNERRSVLIFV